MARDLSRSASIMRLLLAGSRKVRPLTRFEAPRRLEHMYDLPSDRRRHRGNGAAGDRATAGRKAAAVDAGLGSRAGHRPGPASDRGAHRPLPRRRSRRRTIDRDQARSLLSEGIRACDHCRPDTDLGVLG
ncbi:DUF6233 domain-containing protein [[Kitasatospora] papulosa]|uniref:DUF6233 domain-containing protein n=2 Tax=[Kitasatospora] papulosa TaxID=1464011 RepID=UPI0036AB9825